MSIIKKMETILSEGDTAGAEQLIHDDYQFLMHSSGKTLGKKDVVNWIGMKDVKKDNVRVLFENDEVGFEHAMVTFNDGNKEAVMTYYKFKDGKVVGRATGGEYGFRLDKSIALAMVKPDLANVGEKLKVDILGKMYEATILEESPYDGENKLLRA